MVSVGKEDSRQPVVTSGDPNLVFLNKNKFIIVDGADSPDTVGYHVQADPYSAPTPEAPVDPKVDPETPVDPVAIKDVPDLSDIENITFEEYYDEAAKTTRIRCSIKIRNSSSSKSNVSGVDARIHDYSKDTATTVAATGAKFIKPMATTPLVKFDRSGTAIAWGWNEATVSGSYSSISYEWHVGTTSDVLNTVIDSGTIDHTSTGSFPIGNSGVSKKYRVSSGQGDTPATSSPRWLIARTCVTGTNGTKYYSGYSVAI